MNPFNDSRVNIPDPTPNANEATSWICCNFVCLLQYLVDNKTFRDLTL